MKDKIFFNMGKWSAEYAEDGSCTKVVYDEGYLRLLGVKSPDEVDETDSENRWKAVIHPDDLVTLDAIYEDIFLKHPEGMDYDTECRMLVGSEYRSFHFYGHCTRRADGSVSRIDGVIFDIQDIVDGQKAQEELVQNNARLFALEDSFEVLYDVDMITGRYEILAKGQTFGEVNSKLINNNSFFDDVGKNLDLVYPEDRQGNYDVTRPEFIREALDKEDHFDRYYRLLVGGEPVWARMRILYKDASKRSVIIGVFNAAEEMAARELEERLHEETEIRLRHEKLRAEVLSRMIDFDDDPIEVLKGYAESLRVLINCDQVIYRDLEETRIMVNSPAIEKTWSVPIEYCQQCEHFDAHHPMYAGGYTEMDNCQEGWQGIPVYHDCPIKSSLTRIIYVDGETAGYLAIHYVQNYHSFTDLERRTVEEFARIISISLSRYKARMENRELKIIRKMKSQLEESLAFTNYFLDTYVSAYYVDFENLSCQVYKRTEELEDEYPIITNYLDSITEYINRDVHPEDRRMLLDAVRPERMKAMLKDRPEYSHILRDLSGGVEKTYRMQVIRGADENHAAFGFIDITEETKEQNRRLAEAENTKKLVESVAASYDIAYAVNMADDSFTLLKLSGDVVFDGGKFKTYSESKAALLELVHEMDRERMRRELDYDTIRSRLQDRLSYNVEFRTAINGETTWHQMNVTQIDEDNVALGYADRDTELTKLHLEEMRYDEYFALFVVDVHTGMLKIVKNEEHYRAVPVGKSVPFSQYIQGLAQQLDDEPRAFYMRLSDLDNVRRDFACDNKRTYSYKSSHIGDGNSWVDITAFVIQRNEDGSPAMITLGFSLADAMATERQELQRKYKEALDVVSEEKRRNDILHDIINSGKWSFRISPDDEVISADYSAAVMRIVDNDFSSNVYDWVQILHLDDKEEALAAFYAAIADHSGNTPYDVTYRMADRNGVYHWFHSAGRIVRNEDGSGEFFGIHIDITSQIEEQLAQQQLLEDAREAADAANQAKSNFLFNMSHDIRTPMNAIRGFTSMAKKHLDDKDKVNEYLDKIEISGQQLLTLINQVLEMARIESGKVVIEEKPVDVQEEFNSMVTVLSEHANTHGLNFSAHLFDLKHRRVLADEARISSITLNIVGNAMKYTPKGGSVEYDVREIPARKPGFASFIITVSDTGIGMSEEYLKELYEPFTREKSSTVSKIQGTGLGLSIVKNTIDLMGGNIEVQSELGKGTRFDITVDFKIDDSAAKAEAQPESGETVSFEGRRVLLVEDNEMNREIAKDILEEAGLAVEDAEDGDVAVNRMRELFDRGEFGYYDFILMDVQMPRMNGFEATKAIRAMCPEADIPIIAVSANAFEEDKKASLAAGMNDHVAKPIDVKELMNALAKYLRNN